MKVFSQEWFEHHQSKLLWLCNHWLTRRWFKWILHIRRCDVGFGSAIVQLLPHCYTVANEDGSFTADFRTHTKFAKRLYYAFKPLWWTLHFWDWLLADRWMPRFSFGFATLTVYPDPGTGLTTCDGTVNRSGVDEIFTTIRGGAGTGVGASADNIGPRVVASVTSNQFERLTHMIYTFDTSTIGGSSTISTVTLSLFGVSKLSGLGETPIHIAAASPAANNTLTAADYPNVQRTTFGNIAHASLSTTAYNDFTLNGDGITNINKTGISRFSAQTEWDINNSFTGVWASIAETSFTAHTADAAGTATDPKLVVNYGGLDNYILEPNNIRPGRFKPGNAR